MAGCRIDRPESLEEGTLLVPAVDRRDEDHIPFVPLDVFQVLDEEWFEAPRAPLAIGLRGGIRREERIELRLEELTLRLIQRHNPERYVGTPPHELGGLLDDRARLGVVPAIAVCPVDLYQADASVGVAGEGRGKDDERIVAVELVVREGD